MRIGFLHHHALDVARHQPGVERFTESNTTNFTLPPASPASRSASSMPAEPDSLQAKMPFTCLPKRLRRFSLTAFAVSRVGPGVLVGREQFDPGEILFHHLEKTFLAGLSARRADLEAEHDHAAFAAEHLAEFAGGDAAAFAVVGRDEARLRLRLDARIDHHDGILPRTAVSIGATRPFLSSGAMTMPLTRWPTKFSTT